MKISASPGSHRRVRRFQREPRRSGPAASRRLRDQPRRGLGLRVHSPHLHVQDLQVTPGLSCCLPLSGDHRRDPRLSVLTDARASRAPLLLRGVIARGWVGSRRALTDSVPPPIRIAYWVLTVEAGGPAVNLRGRGCVDEKGAREEEEGEEGEVFTVRQEKSKRAVHYVPYITLRKDPIVGTGTVAGTRTSRPRLRHRSGGGHRPVRP